MNAIKTVKNVFAVSKDGDTIDEMNRVNIQVGLITSPVIAFFEVMMIVLTSKNIAAGASPIRQMYMLCYIILLVATLLALVLSLVWRRNLAKYRSAIQWLTHLYSLLIILWAVAVTYLDISRGGQLTVYLTVLVVLACAFYLHPWTACVIFGGSAAVLMALSYVLVGHTFEIVINLLVFAVFMTITSIVRYAGKKTGMFKEAVIVKQNRELNVLNEQLKILSRTDMLTGLYNRRHYDETAAGIARQCAENGQEMAAILMDIDEFKKINDTYGHKTGDVCISAVAGIILRRTQQYGGTAYRFGGEEFLSLIPDCGAERVVQLAEAIRAEVEAAPMEGVPYAVTLSAGCYAGRPGLQEAGAQADAFVNRADHAMYRAKAAGRNGVVLDGLQ